MHAHTTGMNGVLKIFKPDGIRQQIIARCIRCSRYKERPNDRPPVPPVHEEGQFVQVNGRIIKVYMQAKSVIVLANKNHKNSNKKQIPSPPTTCCMSGCANCVYIAYAEEVTKIFSDGGQLAKEIILENIDDPNMKCFLSMELRNAENKLKK